MKSRFNIFLGTIFILISVVTACFIFDSKKTSTIAPTIIDFSDTTFIKAIKWDSLNTFVDYYILQNGHKTTDTNFYFIAKPIVIYHYFNNKFEVIKDTSKLNFKQSELKELILVDSFSNKTNFECLLRINTEIGFHYRPDLLQTVTVRAKDMSDKNIKWLMADLKKESFVQSTAFKIQEDTFLNKTAKTVFINIKLQPDYWNLKKINEICRQLNKRPDIDKAFFNDFLTGLNEGETIYYLTTDEKSSR